jgi:glycosyltransferase involved in cell wall biosynthesis
VCVNPVEPPSHLPMGHPGQPMPRPSVLGPNLWLGEHKLTVKGATYGTFAAGPDGTLFPPRGVVRDDFAAMVRAGVNTVRVYTPPPDWLLHEARAAGLRVLCGVHWESRDCVFDDRRALRAAEHAVRDAVRRLRAFPDVVLAYVIGNEVPPLVARFHGRRTIERALARLCAVARREDPGCLVTYGTYPSTEFLQLDFLDFLTLNVYLLEPKSLAAYLDRMLNQAKGKPLLLGEIGDDSLRRGEAWQAELLDWTIPLALEKGVCGVTVFSWTDDWVVGGHRMADRWAFGLVDERRRPKPAHDVVARHFRAPALDTARSWPRVSVVVCNYNGGATLDETLQSLLRLDYPDYEVIYVDDGSTDDSLQIAKRYESRLRIVAQENRGLSVARNVGAHAATGAIVAYIDSDAYADPDWLRFLVLRLQSGGFAGVGGPNLTPPGDGQLAQWIGYCPGNPTHVLEDDVRADHIAGVNMAFRRDLLLELGGFDPVHRAAGDDVDICWRFRDAGYELAFAPAAVVWHHRRPSLRRYLKQQWGYGVAEHQLEGKYPERFNAAGQILWKGRVYLAPRRPWLRPFVYHGTFGTALFQSLYQREPSRVTMAASSIQWYWLWAILLVCTPLSPWLGAAGLLLLASSLWNAIVVGWTTEPPGRLARLASVRKTAVIAAMHFVHPIVRWLGRVRAARRAAAGSLWPHRFVGVRPLLVELLHVARNDKERRSYWGPGPDARPRLLADIQRELKQHGIGAGFGADWDNHDLNLWSSLAAAGRLYSAPEHYDRALCIGLRMRVPLRAWQLLLASVGVVLLLATADARSLWLLLLPAMALLGMLHERAYLRTRAWLAVDAVLQREGAVRLGKAARARTRATVAAPATEDGAAAAAATGAEGG